MNAARHIDIAIPSVLPLYWLKG